MFIVPGVILVIMLGISISQESPLPALFIESYYNKEEKEMTMMEKIKNYLSTLSETITVTKLDGLLAVLAAVMFGCIVGMLISPRTTKTIGCGNGCTRYLCREEDECEEE